MRAAKLKGGATNKVMKLNEIRKRETEHVPAKRHHSRRTRGRIIEKPKMEFSKYSSLDPRESSAHLYYHFQFLCYEYIHPSFYS